MKRFHIKHIPIAILFLLLALPVVAAGGHTAAMKRAMAGDAISQFRIGSYYLDEEEPLGKDLAKARFWLKMAIATGLKGDLVMMSEKSLAAVEEGITPEEIKLSEEWLKEWEKTGKIPGVLRLIEVLPD